MTCLINYSPEEQHELQWLAQEAAAQHSWAQDSHETLFSSQTGQLKSLQLADSLQDTLWAMSLVRSRTFSERVHSLCNRLHCKSLCKRLTGLHHSADACALLHSSAGLRHKSPFILQCIDQPYLLSKSPASKLIGLFLWLHILPVCVCMTLPCLLVCRCITQIWH